MSEAASLPPSARLRALPWPSAPVLLVLGLLALWQAATLVPGFAGLTPSDVLGAFLAQFRDPLLPATLATLWRFAQGFALGCAVAIPLGLLMGAHPVAERVLGSIVHPLRQIPLFGWIPLIGLTFGLGEGAKIVFVALAVGYVMVLAAWNGLRDVPPSLREVAMACGLGPWDRGRLLVAPAVMPSLMAGARTSFAVGWSAVFGAEILLTAGSGLGTVVWSSRELGRSDLVVVGTLVIIAIGIAVSALLGRLEARLFRWRAPLRGGRGSPG